GQRLEHAGVDLLRLAQPSLLLQRHRLLQRLSDIWPRAMRNGHRQRSFTGEAKSSARARSCYQLPQFVRRRSIIVAFPLGPRLKGFRPAVIRVRIAKSAVAGNHLRDALFEGSHAAMENKWVAPTRARAPGALVSSARASVEQNCRCDGH